MGKQFLAVLIAFVLATPATANLLRSPQGEKGNSHYVSLRPADAVLPTNHLAVHNNSATNELGLVFACLTSLTAGYVKGAEHLCTAAIKLGGEDPAPYKLRGIAYLLESRFEQARVDFVEAIDLDPKDSESHIGYAQALEGQGDYKKAISEIGIAIRLAPADYRMWNARCWARGNGNIELAKALDDCNRALRLSPGQPEVLDSRGFVYLRRCKFILSERDFTAALRKNPDLASARYGRGIARLHLGDVRRAQSDILSARARDQNIDDLFFWKPLLSRRCLAGAMTNQGWQCRPGKAAPSTPSKASRLSKTASSR